MLVRGIRQLATIVGPLLFLTSVIIVLKINGGSIALPQIVEQWNDGDFLGGSGGKKPTGDLTSGSAREKENLHIHADDEDSKDEFDLNIYGKPAHEVFSISGKNGKYFSIDFGDYEGINPNFIPHPSQNDTWVLVAQQQRTDVWNTVWFAELTCDAKFVNNKLTCIKSPLLLTIAPTFSERCMGELAFLAFGVGPHDARAFFGPQYPYVMYGSQSQFNCFGLFIQDLRVVTDWGIVVSRPGEVGQPFRHSTEIQRPLPYGQVEKNWFVFWDNNNIMHTHYDIYPKRGYAKLNHDGTPGPDLAPLTALDDEKCMNRYMPKLPPKLESIHQATNSLKVTMCKRSDPSCKATDANTFIMTIFQHKTFYSWHGVYEPYVMLFKHTAPFGMHAISTKPLWFHGRKAAPKPDYLRDEDIWDQTQMFYVTSINWKERGLNYHGYLDDAIMIGFGIEDKRAAGMDVIAGDILDHLGLCSDVADDFFNAAVAPDVALGIPDMTAALGGSSVLVGGLPQSQA